MEIVVPELGESIVEATVARWLKKEGEQVTAGEPLVELETDKVDLEVSAQQDGVLVKIAHPDGSDVQVGQVLGVVAAAGEGAEGAALGDGAAPAAETAGERAETTARPKTEPQAQSQPEPAGQTPAGVDRATPVARRLASEQGLDLAHIPGSGPGERVTKEDVQQFMQRSRETAAPPAPTSAPAPQAQPLAAPAQAAQPAPAAPTAQPAERRPEGRGAGDGRAGEQPAPRNGRHGLEERIRMSRRRRTIAARLVEAQQTAAMLTTFNDVDMSAVMDIRKRRRDSFLARYGIRLGLMSFFVKASIGALKEFPQLNAEIQGDEIVLKRYYDIGMAIGAEEGLVVPVLRDADRMSFAAIEKAIQDYSQKVQQGSLSLEDLRGGTFTITNGGIFGSLLSTPILNPPQVGILGLHRIEDRPVVVDGQVVIRPMMYMALSYDHRIVDGREAVQFLARVRELIQDPESLLLEG